MVRTVATLWCELRPVGRHGGALAQAADLMSPAEKRTMQASQQHASPLAD
jgi:hypothetical protein